MSNNARRSPGPIPVKPAAPPKMGAALGSGVRDTRRENALSPGSGVRAAHVDLPKLPPRVAKTEKPTLPATDVSFVPPRPEWESDSSLTQIGDPDPSLLAMSRGDKAEARSGRLVWFLAGVAVGAVVVWAAIGDPPGDVYRARVWAANELRALHASPEPSPAPSAAPSEPPAPSSTIPTVDVSDLPRVSTPAPASAVTPASPPPAPGAPALSHAPGPR